MMGDLPKMWIWRRRQFATWPVRDRRHRGRGEHRRASGGRSGRAGAHPAIAVAVIGGLAAVGLVAFIAYRVRHRRSVSGAARAARPPALVRAARPLPPPRQAIERAPEVHLHFHGVTAEDVAAIVQDSPGVNLGGQQRVTWAWRPGRMDAAPAVVVAALRQLGAGVHGGRGCRILPGGGVRRPPGRVTAHPEHRRRPARD